MRMFLVFLNLYNHFTLYALYPLSCINHKLLGISVLKCLVKLAKTS